MTGNGKANGNGPEPKKWLFIGFEALSGDLAWKLVQEGHEVKMHLSYEKEKEIYDGFFEKVDDWKKFVDWADIIVIDDVGYGKDADLLRQQGKLVIGGSAYTDKLEMDREFGQNEMERVGMSILQHWDFAKFDDAISFIRQNPGRYVFKPSGFVLSEYKGILFLGQDEDGNDLIQILEQNKKLWAKKIKRFQLQKMAVGVEVAVGAFFNGQDFIYPVNINFEHKKLFPGDIGPYTGEMGTLMFWAPPNTLFQNTLLKIKDDLAKSGYVGYIDINCIANAKGIFPLEFTSRFGYPTISIQIEGITMPMAEFLTKLVTKEQFEIKVKKGFQVGIVVAVPPFPYEDPNESYIYNDLSILFRKNNLDGIHLGDIKKVNDVWTVASNYGYALVVTGSGITVDDARKQMYSRVKNIVLQNIYYRTDIGLKWYQDSDKLQTWGYLY